MKNTLEFWVSLIVAIALVFIIAIWVPGEPGTKVVHAVEYAALLIVFLLGILVLTGIASGRIDISKLLEEQGGGASMSRFQLLVFTFVIGLSLLFIAVNKNDFPDVPANILGLLGISATTYGVSKGIQATTNPAGVKGSTPAPVVPPPGPPTPPKTTP